MGQPAQGAMGAAGAPWCVAGRGLLATPAKPSRGHQGQVRPGRSTPQAQPQRPRCPVHLQQTHQLLAMPPGGALRAQRHRLRAWVPQGDLGRRPWWWRRRLLTRLGAGRPRAAGARCCLAGVAAGRWRLVAAEGMGRPWALDCPWKGTPSQRARGQGCGGFKHKKRWSVLTFVLFGRCEIVYKSHKHREGWWGLEEALRLSTTKTPRIPQRIFILYTHDRSSVESSRTPHPMLSLVVVAPLAMRPAAARNRVNPRRLGVWYIGKPWSRTCDGA